MTPESCDNTNMIEGFKAIADELSKRSGFTYTPDTVRKAMRRKDDPLPVDRFDGRVGIKPKELDAWIARRRGIARKRTAA